MIEGGLAALIWKVADPVLRAIGGKLYDRYLRYRIRRDIRRGTGDKIHILLARLAEDTPTDSHRTTLYDTIRDDLGEAVQLTNWPEPILFGDGHEYDIERGAFEDAAIAQGARLRPADLRARQGPRPERRGAVASLHGGRKAG